MIPLSKAVLAVIALWTAVGQWNSYFNALIYLRNPDLQPLQLVLCMYPFVQKHFNQGVMLGSLKG